MKRVIVLVGPKGASKSTIGQLLEAQLGIPFVRVEPIYLRVRAALGAAHPDLERDGFQAILAQLEEVLSQHDTICFETTGASQHTPWLLAELGRSAQVLLVQILAQPAQCLERIHNRDAAIHIPVSDEAIERINAVAVQVALPWTATFDNRGELDGRAILATISGLLQDHSTSALSTSSSLPGGQISHIPNCPECGAAWPVDQTCQDYFHQMLFWEAEKPEYGAQVHHLMVLCYHLQHPSMYSREGLAHARQLLAEFVEHGATPIQLRRRNRARVDSSRRTWKIIGTADSHGSYAIGMNWTYTAADVVANGVDSYCDSVRAWAQSIHAELAKIDH